jgi:hypothetical protein
MLRSSSPSRRTFPEIRRIEFFWGFVEVDKAEYEAWLVENLLWPYFQTAVRLRRLAGALMRFLFYPPVLLFWLLPAAFGLLLALMWEP